MRPILPLAMLLPLAACNSILDPAPYIPYNDPAVASAIAVTSSVQPGDSPKLSELTFVDLTDARDKLLAIGDGYLTEANALSRQQLGFDVPAIGLGVASVVSLSFHGAANATAALGLGSGTIYGSKTYFEPGTKISAYASAYNQLFCAARAAGDLATAKGIYSAAYGTETMLTAHIQQAADLLDASPNDLPSDTKTKLMTARDAAQAALTNLTAALNTEISAPTQLQDFALATIAKTSDTIRNGVPSAADVLASIKSSVPATTPPSAPAAVTPPAAGLKPSPGQPVKPTVAGTSPAEQAAAQDATDAATLIGQLNNDVTNTKSAADGINTAWSGFSQCATLN